MRRQLLITALLMLLLGISVISLGLVFTASHTPSKPSVCTRHTDESEASGQTGLPNMVCMSPLVRGNDNDSWLVGSIPESQLGAAEGHGIKRS